MPRGEDGSWTAAAPALSTMEAEYHDNREEVSR
eukprot:COSAG02_NODE_26525_length_631_cov_0.776316_1_plen_32_part_10